MKLPTLYKKTSTGAIQYWTIKAEETNLGFTFGLGNIRTEYGQLNTDSPQITDDVIHEGKNAGKKNATTAIQQAEAEAHAKWEKQKKKGYVESIQAAEAGELDDLIEGGVEPMLAHSYMDVLYDMRPGHENDLPQLIKTKDAKKIKFPLYMQPKFDGIRCVAILKNGECTLWSRTRKPIKSVPHIARAIEVTFKAPEIARILKEVFGNEDIVLDGELYNHLYKNDFEKIVSAVRKDEPSEGSKLVEYHVYDIIAKGSFEQRLIILDKFINFTSNSDSPIKGVYTRPIQNEETVMSFFENSRKRGYEGAMLRNSNAPYINKRSYDLQKLKEFHEDEFAIFGIEEGRGKLAGCVGSFICLTKEKTQFSVKLEGDTEYLKQCFENHSLWQGKKLTVVYQGYTVAEKKPRFPVGKVIRDYE